MTANQINFWRLQEDKRHNVVGEGETRRHNIAGEVETSRHNRADESLRGQANQETERHNLVTEYITTAHNVATEQEANRSNLAKEMETNRHNLVTEATNIQGLNDAWIINKYNAETNRNKAVSDIRVNDSKSDNLDSGTYKNYVGMVFDAIKLLKS